jgi:hypothetical protein
MYLLPKPCIHTAMIFAILSRRIKEDIAYEDFRRADPADLRKNMTIPAERENRRKK